MHNSTSIGQSLDHLTAIYKVFSVANWKGWKIGGFIVTRVDIRSGVVQERFGLASTIGTLPVSDVIV